MKPEELAAIEQRASAATPGPWATYRDETWMVVYIDANNGVVVAPEGDNLILSVADAEFIAAARTDIPALISEIRRLEQAYLEALRMVGDAIGLLGEMSEP